MVSPSPLSFSGWQWEDGDKTMVSNNHWEHSGKPEHPGNQSKCTAGLLVSGHWGFVHFVGSGFSNWNSKSSSYVSRGGRGGREGLGRGRKEAKLFMPHLPTYLVDQVLLCVQDALKQIFSGYFFVVRTPCTAALLTTWQWDQILL